MQCKDVLFSPSLPESLDLLTKDSVHFGTDNLRIKMGIIKKIIPAGQTIENKDFLTSGNLIQTDQSNISNSVSSLQVLSEKKSYERSIHDPNVLIPIKIRPNQKKEAVPFINKVLNKLKRAYEKPQFYLKEINFLYGRQMRSEMREAIINVCRALIQYHDMATSAIGHYTQQGIFWGPHFDIIANLADIKKDRAYKARAFLVNQGLLMITPRVRRKENGQYQSLPGLYQFSEQFFLQLGYDRKEFDIHKGGYIRDKAKKNRYKNQSSEVPLPPFPKAPLKRPIIRAMVTEEEAQKQIAHKKSLIQRALERFKQDPSKSEHEHYFAILKEQPA